MSYMLHVFCIVIKTRKTISLDLALLEIVVTSRFTRAGGHLLASASCCLLEMSRTAL